MKLKHLLLTACLAIATHAASGQEKAANPAPIVPESDKAAGFSGKVAETMNAGSYTYILVDTGTKKQWAAAPRFNAKVGETVTVPAGIPMPKYHSKILNRDFDSVCFVDSVEVQGAAPAGKLPAGHPTLPVPSTAELPKDHPPIPGLAKPKVDLTGIKKAKNGKTVQEIYAGMAKLAGKAVTVRGKIVKYNPDIMGKNWLHVQDGTGNPGSDDLMVTSTTAAKVGDTVLVSGTVSTNKDFGAGYKYAVILDGAEVVVE